MNVTARSYAIQIADFSYCIGAALAQANAIMTGWRIGAKEYEECDRGYEKSCGIWSCNSDVFFCDICIGRIFYRT